MAVSLVPYDKFISGQITGAHFVDFDTDTIKLALFTNTFTPAQTQEFFSGLSGETSGTNYTAGGAALSSKVVGTDTSGTPHFVYWNAATLTFTNVVITFRWGVLYKDTGTPSTSPLIAYIDFGADQSPAGVDYDVQWPLSSVGGIIQFRNMGG